MPSRWKDERHVTYDGLQWVKEPSLIDAVADACGEGDAVLELGCGTGVNLKALKGRFRRRVGLEASEEMLDQVGDPSIETVRGFLQDAPYEAEFDCAVMRNVLHYVEYPQDGVAAAFRALRPGGRFVLVEGVPPDRHTADRYAEIFSHLDRRHVFHEGDLIQLVHQAGFRDITVRPVFLRGIDLYDWIDKRTDDERARRTLRRLHDEADEHFRTVYEMEEQDGRVFMTWRFAVVTGRRPPSPAA